MPRAQEEQFQFAFTLEKKIEWKSKKTEHFCNFDVLCWPVARKMVLVTL